MSHLTHWQPWQPTATEAWSIERVVHLHRRAGFAATWSELERDLNGDPQEAVSRVLEGTSRLGGIPDDFESMSEVIGQAAVGSGDPVRLQAWWIYRMLFSPDPLGERLTLMWHNHFATSNLKVDNLSAMKRQNEIFRTHAKAPFGTLIREVVKDPALLIWLDASENRKRYPNENLAREIMELFALGVGNYTEEDVKEAARALTGWTVQNDRFAFDARRHDDGEKTILGKTAAFDGDRFVTHLLDQPAVAKRLVARLCDEFFGEFAVGDEAKEELAAGLRENDLRIDWAVETILRSRTFFSSESLRCRVLGPAEYVVGMIRALEQTMPPPGTLPLAKWIGRLGQTLFYPPNVFGWPGGRSWMTSRSLIGRANFAHQVVRRKLHSGRKPDSPIELPIRNPRENETPARLFLDLCGIRGDRPELVAMINDLDASYAAEEAGPETVQNNLARLLSAPEAMLG